MQLAFTNSNATAQRLAKIALYRGRHQISASIVTNLKGFQCAVGDTIQVTNSRLGWTDKTFQVASWNLSI